MGKSKKNKNKFSAAFNKPQPKAEIPVEESAKRTKRIIIIFVSAFLAAALLFGIVLASVMLAKNASYAVKLDNVGITEGVANYFVTEFKAEYIKKLNSAGVIASDTAAFWNSPYINSTVSTSTHGDYLKYYVENSIKSLIASNIIFDKYAKLTSADKNKIAITVDEILEYRANGSKAQFNADTEQYGFGYNDFKRGIEMLYKANVCASRIFGTTGDNVRNFPEFCDEFFMGSDTLEGYKRFKIVFVRTQDTFLLDENGNRVKDENGNDKLRYLTAEEKAQRLEYINLLESCIEGFKNGTVATEVFDETAEKVYKYNDNLTSDYKDYYLYSNSSFVSEFGEVFSDVTEAAFGLSVGEVTSVEYGAVMSDTEGGSFVGKVYIYRVATDADAYKRTDEAGFFTDFNKLAASALYSRWSNEYAKEVELRAKWENINIITHKYTSNYGV